MKNFTRIAMLLAIVFFMDDNVKAQTNIAPAATPTCSRPWNWNNINNNNLGTCGRQTAFVWTANPPTNGEYMQWVWKKKVGMSEIVIHHAQTNARFLTGGTIQKWTGSAWVDHYTFSGLSQSNCKNTVTFPAFFSTQMRIHKMKMRGTGQTSNPNFREIQIYLKIFGANNAGVSGIDGMSPCTGTQDIKATIANFGVNRIDSVTVNWTLNGVSQASFLYKKDTLGLGEDVKLTLKAGHKFAPNSLNKIVAWTSIPNGKSDTVTLNDTAIYEFFFNGEPNSPTAPKVSHCGIGQIDLTAKPDNPNDSLFWFEQKVGGSPFAVGKNVKSPFLYSSDTMYVNAFRRGAEDSVSNGLSGGTIVSGNAGMFNGDMFDIKVKAAPISIGKVTISMYRNQASSYEVYIKSGTYVGNQTNATAWTLVTKGTATPYNANGQNNLIDIELGNLLLTANSVTGMYITTTTASGNDIFLTNGNGGVSNRSFDVVGGSAIYGPFGSGGGVYNTWTIDHAFTFAITCATSSGRVAVPIEIKRLPTGSGLAESTPFEGIYAKGSMNNPDRLGEDSTATYEIIDPSLFPKTTYGSDWSLKVDFRTASGTPVPSGFSVTTPTSSANGEVQIKMLQGWADSMIAMTMTISDLNNGCDTTVVRYINVSPIPRTNFEAPDACLGTPIEFRNTTTLSSGFATYLWDFGDGTTSTFIDPIHTYKNFGKFKVHLTVTSNYGVSKDTTIEIEVFEIPDIQFRVKHACEDENLTIINNTKISSGSITYSWKYGDGTTGNSSASTHTKKYAQPGSYKITLRASANGCNSVASRNANQFARPTAAFTSVPDCIGSETEFTNTSVIELNEKIGSVWSFGDGEVETVTSPNHVYATAGAKTVKLVAVSQFGCSDSTTRNIVIKDGPIASFEYDKACNVDPVTFTNTSTEPSGLTVIYAWNFGDGANTSQKSPTHKYPNLGVYNVSLVATADNGCTSEYSADLRVLIQPVADFEAEDVCSNEGAIFVNKTKSAGNVVYKWYFGDGDSSDLVAPKHKYAGTTQSYGVRLLAFVQDGCTDEITKTVNVNASPGCGFTYSQSEADRTEFTFTPNDQTHGAGAYTWVFKGSGTEKSMSPVKNFEYTETKYRVFLRIITADGCECTDSSTVVTTTWGSVGNNPELGTVNVYPNPNNGTFNISLEGWKANEALSVRISDAQGRVVYENTENNVIDSEKVLTLEGLARGVYNLEVANNQGKLIKKIVVAE
jgi:PKD repeat protein